jgi:hypothetical protein
MFRRTLFLISVSLAGFGLAALTLAAHGQDDTTKRGRKYKSPPPTARIEVTILKDVNGKPIESASVIFHPMVGEKDEGNMEQKTNEDGKTIIDVLPIGDTVRLQVIARGFQTYGEDFSNTRSTRIILPWCRTARARSPTPAQLRPPPSPMLPPHRPPRSPQTRPPRSRRPTRSLTAWFCTSSVPPSFRLCSGERVGNHEP